MRARGFGDGTFGPGDYVTHEQFESILQNFEAYKGLESAPRLGPSGGEGMVSRAEAASVIRRLADDMLQQVAQEGADEYEVDDEPDYVLD